MPERAPWDHAALIAAIKKGGTWTQIAARYNALTNQQRPMQTVYNQAAREKLRPPHDPTKPGRPRLSQ